MTNELRSEIVGISSLNQNTKHNMFAIYRRYYEPATSEVFFNDLSTKSHVLTLNDDAGQLRGFSTLKTWKVEHNGCFIQMLYSGDTIIEQEFWGSQALSFNWIEFAGAIKAKNPDIPLYWFLITKGHRTYRYMTVFSKTYFPKHDQAPPAGVQNLMHKVGRETFGDQYCANTGIVLHREDSAALKSEFHGPRVKNKSNKEIDFFIMKNPGYESGDELLCLCELSSENLTPMARKQFERGLKNHVMAKIA